MPSSKVTFSLEELSWDIAPLWKVLIAMGIETDAVYHSLLLFLFSMMDFPLKRRSLVALILAIPALTEIAQFFMPGRVPDFMDAFHGYLGILLAYSLIQMWRELVPVVKKFRLHFKGPDAL